MSWNQNQGQTGGEQDPYPGYGTPQNPYETPPPGNPYVAPQNPYGAPPPPENPYGTPPPSENPYAAPQNPYAGTNYGGYQQGQQGYGYAPPQATPRPLGQAIQQLPGEYVRVLTHPSAQTFAAEIGKADWGIVWVQLIAYAVIGAVLAFLSSLISPTRLSSATTSGISPTALTALVGGISFAYIIIIPIFFFIGMGILYGLAKAFGGQGTFLQQSYATLLFQVPLGILTSLIGLIPIAGAFIALIIDIYSIVLQIFAIMAVHRLSGGKATAVVLIPVAVVLLLVCAFVVIIIAIAANAVKNGGY
ncbi:MAG TPA: YIP1 family protein [Ktedonobacteraceae bacterium]|nr:YIP1 family protein [Ktedonobacteraceae bacterium]